MRVRAWRDGDAEAVARLHTRAHPEHSWDAAAAHAALTGDAVGGGAHVRVAVDGGAVVGAAGFVRSAPWMFVWPLLADRPEVAAALLDAVIADGPDRDTATVRAAERRHHPWWRHLLADRGFAPSIDIVTHQRPVGHEPPPSAVPAGTTLRVGEDIDRADLCATYNLAFAGTPNSAPATRRDLDVMLDGPAAWPGGTAVLAGSDGRCRALVLGALNGRLGVVEGIATHPDWVRHGLAAWLLRYLLHAAAREGRPAVQAVIASTNTASLGLHVGHGFAPHTRKHMWDLEVAASRVGCRA